MLRSLLFVALPLASLAPVPASAASSPAPLVDRYQAIRAFVGKSADALWPGMGGAPFGILLLGDDDERLYCRSPLPPGFTVATDSTTGCATGTRPRSSLPGGLLAAMPVFGLPSTIVMGSPQKTGRSDADWTRTILHEHFHQWQDALPNGFGRIGALDLAGPDGSAMWMLNFPFPYRSDRTAAAFAIASRALGTAVDARGTPRFKAKLESYLQARAALADAVGARNWRYAEFELWKAWPAGPKSSSANVFPIQRFALPLWRSKRKAVTGWTRTTSPARDAFVYPYGTAEAMLLESCGPSWRRAYPRQLSLGPMLERAARSCR